MTKIEITNWTSHADILDLEMAIHEHRIPPGPNIGEEEMGEAYGFTHP
ncbi:MAG: GntR family transcriptional regulator, partial [Aestuariivita sp.]|nr:GntR family transcriptional regulator [Aestuariivita sp.]